LGLQPKALGLEAKILSFVPKSLGSSAVRHLLRQDGGNCLYLWKSYALFMQQETVNVFIAYMR